MPIVENAQQHGVTNSLASLLRFHRVTQVREQHCMESACPLSLTEPALT